MVASAATSNQSPNLGSGATSHLGGGAGWWKSPSLALARGRDGIACHVSGELRAARQQEGAGRQAPGLLQTRFSLINYVIEQNWVGFNKSPKTAIAFWRTDWMSITRRHPSQQNLRPSCKNHMVLPCSCAMVSVIGTCRHGRSPWCGFTQSNPSGISSVWVNHCDASSIAGGLAFGIVESEKSRLRR
jgi:hypothetical protein